MHHLIVAAADLVLGARCPGCGDPALTVCRPCGEALVPVPEVCWPQPVPPMLGGTHPVPPVASGLHADILRLALIAWKEKGRHGLTPVLSHLLAASVLEHATRGRAVVLVPVPTSRRSRRERGADLVDELARASAGLLCRMGVDTRVAQVLTYARTTVDQSALGADDRAVNVRGALRLRPMRLPPGRDVVVVDDILTTGSTVTEAVRVLDLAGHRPVGIAVVAATPRA